MIDADGIFIPGGCASCQGHGYFSEYRTDYYGNADTYEWECTDCHGSGGKPHSLKINPLPRSPQLKQLVQLLETM